MFREFSFGSFFSSLVLAILATFIAVAGFFYFLTDRLTKEKPKVVIIHAFIPSKIKTRSLYNNPTPKKSLNIRPKPATAPKKGAPKKKIGSKSSRTTGGELNVNDLFKGLNLNTPSTPVKQKAQPIKSRLRGDNRLAQLEKELQKNLSQIKTPTIQLSSSGGGPLTDKEINEIYQKMSQVWEEVYTLPNQYAVLDVSYDGGTLHVSVVSTNLPPDVLNQLIYKLKQLIFTKPFSLRVRFVAKKAPSNSSQRGK
jgi:hypothetical protein